MTPFSKNSSPLNASKGLTLLELIAVLIIFAIFVSLAIPKLFGMVEISRSHEALITFQNIRFGMERCWYKGQSFSGCDLSYSEIENPADNPQAHFAYAITDQDVYNFTITATRNSRDNGDELSTISYVQTQTSNTVSGTGVFKDVH